MVKQFSATAREKTPFAGDCAGFKQPFPGVYAKSYFEPVQAGGELNKAGKIQSAIGITRADPAAAV